MPREHDPLDKRNAIMLLYLRKIELRDIPKKFGWSTRTIQEAVKNMPGDLRQDVQYRELERSANHWAGITEARRAYTDFEAREAMTKVITGEMAVPAASDR